MLGRLKGPKSPGINVIALRLVVAHIKRLVVAHSKTFERAVTETISERYYLVPAMSAFRDLKSGAWLIPTINMRMRVHPCGFEDGKDIASLTKAL